MAVEPLPAVRAADIEREQPEARWLIHELWPRNAQGMIGGQPKMKKSWLGLDMAVSVASGTACLRRFSVRDRGPALIYLAEDNLPAVRARLESICDSRDLDLRDLDIHVVTVPVLRLDLEGDRQRLDATIGFYKPLLVLLDPLVRLHRLDENSASDVSGLLGYLTGLVRKHECALVVAHHTSKKSRARPGQALRGSSDLHAWGASNAYLTEQRAGLTLTLEHRAAPAPDPFRLRLVSRKDGSATHLEVVGSTPDDCGPEPLESRVRAVLAKAESPMRRKELRERLRVNNRRLGLALDRLEKSGLARRTPCGWERPAPTAAPTERPAPTATPTEQPAPTVEARKDAQTALF